MEWKQLVRCFKPQGYILRLEKTLGINDIHPLLQEDRKYHVRSSALEGTKNINGPSDSFVNRHFRSHPPVHYDHDNDLSTLFQRKSFDFKIGVQARFLCILGKPYKCVWITFGTFAVLLIVVPCQPPATADCDYLRTVKIIENVTIHYRNLLEWNYSSSYVMSVSFWIIVTVHTFNIPFSLFYQVEFIHSSERNKDLIVINNLYYTFNENTYINWNGVKTPTNMNLKSHFQWAIAQPPALAKNHPWQQRIPF